MSVTYSAGLMTAYGAAKDAGYTGTYTQFCQALADLAGIIAQATTLPAGSQATAEYNSGTLSFGIPKGDTGATGPTGATGNGIVSVTKTGTSGLVDTYTITFTNGTTTTFEVTNGEVTQAQLDAVIDDVDDLKSALRSGLEADAEWHLGFYLDENGDLCQVEEGE